MANISIVAAPPLKLGWEDLKISDQNNCGKSEQKAKKYFWGGKGGAKFKVGPKIFWGTATFHISKTW